MLQKRRVWGKGRKGWSAAYVRWLAGLRFEAEWTYMHQRIFRSDYAAEGVPARVVEHTKKGLPEAGEARRATAAQGEEGARGQRGRCPGVRGPGLGNGDHVGTTWDTTCPRGDSRPSYPRPPSRSRAPLD